jgi:glycine/D-amino acid oxidase-like deaminating enzyme/nitrite reductase/ring-hydroxylating ferredoxin subunit
MTDEAYWTNGGGTTGYPRLDGRARADVAVIGAGAAGLWTAHELARTGRRVAVLEAGRIGAAAKGGGAGQGSVIQALAYSRISRAAGTHAAHCYAQAQLWALARLAEATGRLGADCEPERRPAYVYAADERSLPELHEEWAAAIEAGVSAGYGTDTGTAAHAGLPLPIAGALRVDDQLQFHPRRLLTALAAELVRRGSAVYEHSRVVTVDAGEPCVVMTETGGSVAAEHVVVATGFPIAGTAAVRRALRPRRELLLAGPVPADRAPGGMYAAVGDSEATIRSAPLDAGHRMVVVAGERYEPGTGGTGVRFARLAAWAAAHAGLTEARFRWSAQDYETDDRLPLIGAASAAPEWRGLWIATGFAGWEAPNAVLAGRLITAGIRGERLPEWAAPFAPVRLEQAARVEDAWSGPVRSVVRHAVEPRERDALDAIRPGDGAVVEIGGEHCAAYRDENGLLRMVSALCPHRGCTVGFNDAEKTWECPCHGSRFATDGTLLQGPAQEPLAPARAYLALASAD